MKNGGVIKIFYRLFFVAAIFFSVFVLSQLGDNFWAVGIAGIVVLVAGYLFFAQNEKEKREEKEHERMELDRKLDELLNAQRAIYTITKRGNARIGKDFAAADEDAQIKDILEKMVSVQERMLSENKKLAEIQVNALKTVAKYNRENARQIVLNVNKSVEKLSEKLRNSVLELQEEIKGTAEAVKGAEQYNQSVLMNQEDGAEKGTDEPQQFFEAEGSERLESYSEMDTVVSELEGSQEPEDFSETEITASGLRGSQELEPFSEEATVGSGLEESRELESLLEATAATVSEPEGDQELESFLEEAATTASEPEGNQELESFVEEVTATVSEPEESQELESLLEEVATTASEPAESQEPESFLEEVTATTSTVTIAPELEDTTQPQPELATEQITEPEQISIPIPEPDQIVIPDPEPIQAPLPSMPVMDDPNKKMSEDDIEALIASLSPHE